MTLRMETNPDADAYRIYLDQQVIYQGALSEVANPGTMMSVHSGGTGSQWGYTGCGNKHVFLDSLRLEYVP
jgi:hypothetical protein